MSTVVFVHQYPAENGRPPKQVDVAKPFEWINFVSELLRVVSNAPSTTIYTEEEIRSCKVQLLPHGANGIVVDVTERSLRTGVRDHDQFVIHQDAQSNTRPQQQGKQNRSSAKKRHRSISEKLSMMKTLRERGVISETDKGLLKDLVVQGDDSNVEEALDAYAKSGKTGDIKRILKDQYIYARKTGKKDLFEDDIINSLALVGPEVPLQRQQQHHYGHVPSSGIAMDELWMNEATTTLGIPYNCQPHLPYPEVLPSYGTGHRHQQAHGDPFYMMNEQYAQHYVNVQQPPQQQQILINPSMQMGLSRGFPMISSQQGVSMPSYGQNPSGRSISSQSPGWRPRNPMPTYPGAASKDEKRAKIEKWMKKRERRNWSTGPAYIVRHQIASSRKRGQDGRFIPKAKLLEMEELEKEAKENELQNQKTKSA